MQWILERQLQVRLEWAFNQIAVLEIVGLEVKCFVHIELLRMRILLTDCYQRYAYLMGTVCLRSAES